MRAIPLTLKFITKSKQRRINALIFAYRKTVNQYLKHFEANEPKLDKTTLALVQNTKLSERYKSNALKQAIGIFKGCKKTKRKIPIFTGFPILDAKFVSIENGKKSFDLMIKLSCLSKGKRLTLPTKKHKRLNYWLDQGKLKQGCELRTNKVIVWVEVDKQSYKQGQSIGIDLGMNKLITTSTNEFLGKEFAIINEKILRKKKNSKSYKCSLKERDNFINRVVNQLPWDKIGILCYENLKNMKTGRKKLRKYQGFRIKQQHWTYRKVVSRIIEKCEENRVRPIYVNPQNTSRICPICNNVDAANRVLEDFCCLVCGYKQDADYVGATNVLRKGLDWLGSLESPNSKSKGIN